MSSGFQKLTGAPHTPHKNGAKRKLTEIRLAGLLEHRGASQQTKRRKFQQKKKLFIDEMLDIHSN